MNEQDLKTTPFQQALASCSGALLTSLLVTPLDVVKVRLQTQQQNVAGNKCFLYCNGLMDHICTCGPNDPKSHWFNKTAHFNGTIDAFVKISRTEGVTTLWSGLSPTLVLAVPATVLYFVAYEQIRCRIVKFYDDKLQDKGTTTKLPFWVPLVSGAAARTFSVSVVSPLELIRTKMQSQKLNYVELNTALRVLIRQDGVIALWRGIFSTLYRDVPFSAIYWMNYEYIKSSYNKSSSLSFYWVSFFGGAVSGLIAATVTTPFDVVKTHQQIEFGENTLYGNTARKQSTMYQVFQSIYRQSGFKGFFAGLTPRLIKVAPSCAIMISTFEYGKRFFHKLANDKQTSDIKLEKVTNKISNSSSSSNCSMNSINTSQILGGS